MNVPPLILGTMYFGSRIDAGTSQRMIERYIESGMDMLDTANNYAFWVTGSRGGESESLIGDWLANSGRRADVRIATKVGARPRKVGGDLQDVEGIRPEAIFPAVDASLQRLHTEVIDLLYIHIDQPDVPLAEILGALGDLVHVGKIRQVGLSNVRADRLREAIELAPQFLPCGLAAVQMRHSIIPPLPQADFTPQQPTTPEILDMLRQAGIPLVAYSPLLEGALTDGHATLPPEYDSDANRRTIADARDQARKDDRTLSQHVIRQLIDSGVSALIGARTPDHLDTTLAAIID